MGIIKTKMNKEFPCICGHLSEDHVSRPYDGKLYCDVRDSRKGRFIDDCIEYIPSNINYLESLVCKGERK
jgi:hypothetical protein